ncbi:unnamed protein product [Parascedosporium putredinis]|uniref:Mitochondrial carrier n=1 Tax=Parascedosporium putredinis TaxID=1442378 RepID=A0A9P1H2P0_9PEZI|nr:unnamed protein product [Parascedosporium putredinis]CAI7995142.1 unnamed protein product [Parascedosporium putredinis]
MSSSPKDSGAPALSSVPTPATLDAKPAAPEAPKAVAAKSEAMAQVRSFVAGGFGGICAVVVGHPFDLVKVRLQTAERGVYSSAIDVVRKSVAKEGLRRGLYAGVSAPLVGVTPMYPRPQLLPHHEPQHPLTIGQISAAGFFSAIPMTLITAPFERVKVILQVQGQRPSPPARSPRRRPLRLPRQRRHPRPRRAGSAAYFAAYEYIKRKLTPKDPVTGAPTGNLSLMAITCAGAAAGVAMWVPVFPIDTVKSRLQTAEGNVTLGGVIREVYGRGGLKAFFPGFGPALARAVPANAATFLGVELAHQAMNKMFN